MASLVNDPDGRKRILVVCPDGGRRAIHLGKMTVKQSESVRSKVEAIVGDLSGGRSNDPEIVKWLAEIPKSLRDRLALLGLIKASDDRRLLSLDSLLADVFKSLQLKPGTEKTYLQTKASLLAFFGKVKLARDIDAREADKWRAWLRNEKHLAQSTISRRVKHARQFFRLAARWKIVAENPFAGVVAGTQANESRMYFIDRKSFEAVMAICPGVQWRAVLALARYGGLRCPSEIIKLRWEDIQWDTGRMTVRSPKTEHIEGKAYRVVPIFPELRPILLEAFEAAPEGSTHVVTIIKGKATNLRTHLLRLVARAGLNPWPKLFQNLRATRETELAELYPIQVVCAWIGNSPIVARRHYLQVTDAHFRKAAAMKDETGARQTAQTATASDRLAQTKGISETTQPPADAGGCAISARKDGTASDPDGIRIGVKTADIPALLPAARSLNGALSISDIRRFDKVIEELDGLLARGLITVEQVEGVYFMAGRLPPLPGGRS